MSARVRDRQGLQESRVGIRCIAGCAGSEPLFQVGWAVHHPPPQLAVDWAVAIEPELGESAFGQANEPRRGLSGNDGGLFWHRKIFRSKCRSLREPPSRVAQEKGFGKKDAVRKAAEVDRKSSSYFLSASF